jgi:hypothetical protein
VRFRSGQFIVLLFFQCAIVSPISAADGMAFFESKIRPVLATHCYECHSQEAVAKGKVKGGLQLDTRTGIRKGGDTGPAVVPRDPMRSLILSALRHEGSLEMPPKGKLSDTIIAHFEKWIAMGAPDPRDGEVEEIVKATDFAKAREFWSLRPIVKPEVPKVVKSEWTDTALDRFVIAKLEEKSLRVNEAAEWSVLIRRLYFDLIGLPPTPEEMEQAKAGSLATLVDELLASRHFGERWGRHWLDLARYADSNGRARNMIWHHAWRYRDWVIDSFNADMPYDHFIRAQIAGDTLPADSQAEHDANMIATGFLALGPKSVEEPKREQFRMDVIDEQIDILSRAFLGLSVACARCHDHKFDPVPTRDYYALAGIFRSTGTRYGFGPPMVYRINNDGGYQAIGTDATRLLPVAAKHRAKVITDTKAFSKARSDRYRVVRRRADSQRKLKSAKGAIKKELETSIGTMDLEIKDWDNRIDKLESELQTLRTNAPPQPNYAMAAVDADTIENSRIHIRGEIATLGDHVPRGLLRVLDFSDIDPISSGDSGRRQLADWIAHRDNPLPARVLVNRVWQHLFGRGLVTTPDDFGKTGSSPSHPALLDYLAAQFIEDGWSIKKLIRRIVLSRSYRSSSAPNPLNEKTDPENNWLWRMSPKRLEVEPFRDAVLTVSGALNKTPARRSVLAGYHTFNELEFNTKIKITQDQMNSDHRSVYLTLPRGTLPEMLQLFDFPDPSTLAGARDETTVPAQSLFLMNSSWMITLAEKLAARLGENGDDESRVRHLFALVYSRSPQDAELSRIVSYVRKHDSAARWVSVCQSVLASAEFRYVR